MASDADTGLEAMMAMRADLPSSTKTADELVAEMKRMPLFMTSMDDLDEDNEMLQAIRAIAYEGTRAEVAGNFRTQDNECVKEKQWSDARTFYAKGLAALKAPRQGPPPDAEVEEIDEEVEEKKGRALEEACYANRNYGSCNRDCAGALRLNPRNVKAWYRAAQACLALDKIAEADDACQGGLDVDPTNVALQSLLVKVEASRSHRADLDQAREDRKARTIRETATLRLARNIAARKTASPPEMEDANVKLEDPVNANSTLTIPMMLLYPLHAQSDFVKACTEHETVMQHLEYVLPTPWDEKHEYTLQSVDCYMETLQGGLIKAGKKLSLLKLLASGKVEIVDGLVSVYVVPRARATEWNDVFKRRKGKA
ncbi:HSP70/90 co-chaperone [Teratosphaeriaceae sp. CCFEE 6253]|nr:HSP70/90 co-chaperone [Teratosphaeriaceae sp. CCFEE 6253]